MLTIHVRVRGTLYRCYVYHMEVNMERAGSAVADYTYSYEREEGGRASFEAAAPLVGDTLDHRSVLTASSIIESVVTDLRGRV